MPKREKITRASFSIEPSLLEEFDSLLRSMGYDRSKGIKTAIRNFITEYRWRVAEGTGSGTIVLLYDLTSKGVEEELTKIQHEHERTISSSMHIHLDERNCLEIIAVKGDMKEIQSLVKALEKRGIKQLKLAIVAP
jgi:CopG family nickel-responsive transcriptional regulator